MRVPNSSHECKVSVLVQRRSLSAAQLELGCWLLGQVVLTCNRVACSAAPPSVCSEPLAVPVTRTCTETAGHIWGGEKLLPFELFKLHCTH